LKESFIKNIGKGLSQPLNSFSIRFSEEGSIGIQSNSVLLDKAFLKQYKLSKDYKLAVCGSSKLLPESFNNFSMEDIIQFFT
jgi:4'-phosphopantetheinyl transferase